MKKQNLWLLILGVIFIMVPFLINIYSIFRLISLLLGIILFLLGLIVNYPRKFIKIVFLPILLIGLCLSLDYLVSFLGDNIPVISFVHKSSEKVKTYNSLFFRVYDCEGVLTFDSNYQKDYLCKSDAIEAMHVNKFLENPEESFQEYKGKFVHLQGKITTIVGNSSLALNAYDEKVELNGYVVFDEGKKVVIENLDIDPAEYYVYDYIDLIGLVSAIEEKDDIVTIHLQDAQILRSDIYEDYEFLVNNINDRELVKTDEKLYYYGIEGIYYKYDENNIYEIDYLLLDKRETLENLTRGVTPNELDEVHKLYELDTYNLIICASEDIIFANQDITNLKGICDFKEN